MAKELDHPWIPGYPTLRIVSPVLVVSSTPKPLHKMATSSASHPKIAGVSEACPNMAASSESHLMYKMVVTSEPSAVIDVNLSLQPSQRPLQYSRAS